MKKKIKNKLLITSALFAFSAAVSTFAQDAAKSPQPADGSVDSSYGLLGSTYVGSDLSYVHHTDGNPAVLHDYDAFYNQNVYQQGITGMDANVGYDYLSGSANNLWTRRQQVAVGFTGYLLQPWGKPFLTGDIGWDWQRSGNVRSHSYQYSLGTGVEFQLLKRLVFTPFLDYSATPRLETLPASASLPNTEWNYGGKFTYRLDRNWSVTAGASADRDRDITYKGGVAYHF